MNLQTILDKVKLEPFLVRNIEDATNNPGQFVAFLQTMLNHPDHLHRVYITGPTTIEIDTPFIDAEVPKAECILRTEKRQLEFIDPTTERVYHAISIPAEKTAKLIKENQGTAVSVHVAESIVNALGNFIREGTVKITINDGAQVYLVSSVDTTTAYVLRDANYWQHLAQSHNLPLTVIPPGDDSGNVWRKEGFDKYLLTPWYETHDPVSGAKLQFGTNWKKDQRQSLEMRAQFAKPIVASRLHGILITDEDLGSPIKGLVDITQGKGYLRNESLRNVTVQAPTPELATQYFGQLLQIARIA